MALEVVGVILAVKSRYWTVVFFEEDQVLRLSCAVFLEKTAIPVAVFSAVVVVVVVVAVAVAVVVAVAAAVVAAGDEGACVAGGKR